MPRPAILRIVFLTLVFPHVGSAQDAEPHASPLDGRYGAYRTEEGEVVTLLAFGHGDMQVRLLTDYAQGYRGRVEAGGERQRLRVVTPDGSPFNRLLEVVPGEDRAGIPTLTLILDGTVVRTATHMPLAVENVRFPSQDRSLAGTVVRPLGVGPAPGVVFVHGSGPATRNDYLEWSYFFAAHGVAALMYDKQGAGESTGDWEEARFSDLAADAAAAVRTLKTHEGVDSTRIGLSGGSQGGWVAPLAARDLGSDVAFLIVTGGGPVTPREQEHYRRMELVRQRGVDAATQAVAARVLTCYFEFVGSLGERCGQELRQHFERYGQELWYLEDVGGPRRDPLDNPWPIARRRFARELDFDAREIYPELKIPILGVLGSNEQTFPVDLAVSRFHGLVRSDLLTLRVIEEADHGLFVDATPTRTRHQSYDAMLGMVEWLRGVIGDEGG